MHGLLLICSSNAQKGHVANFINEFYCKHNFFYIAGVQKQSSCSHLEQSLKLGVFVDWKLCRDVTFVLTVNNQRFCACVKGNTQKVNILGMFLLKWS